MHLLVDFLIVIVISTVGNVHIHDIITNLRRNETEKGNENLPPQTKQTRAIVHIGPSKTGTTTIQRQTKIQAEQLLLDEYEMPWRNLLQRNEGNKKLYRSNQFNFASCFKMEK